MTSCVIEPAEPVTKTRTKGAEAGIGPAQKRALEMLDEAINITSEVPPSNNHIPRNTRCVKIDLWRQYCYQGGIADGGDDAKRMAFKRARSSLLGGNHIGTWGDWVWPT